MKKVEKVVCWICNKEYGGATDAKKCESRGLVVPYFKIGDTATYQVYLGSDRDGAYHEKRTGVVIDILFPVPLKYFRAGYSLLHTYQVSYLVRTGKRENDSAHYFDEENIELLQTTKMIDIVDEARMFFEDGVYINEGLDLNTHRSRRNIVTSWSDYVAEIGRRNPQLKDRLAGLTTKLSEFGCLD